MILETKTQNTYTRTDFLIFIGYIALIPIYEVYRNLVSHEAFSLSFLIQYVSGLGLGSVTFQVGKLTISNISNRDLLGFIEKTVNNGLEIMKSLVQEMKQFTKDMLVSYAEQRDKENRRNAQIIQDLETRMENLSRLVYDVKVEMKNQKDEMIKEIEFLKQKIN